MRDFLAEVERVLPGTLRTEETTPRLVPGSATVVARAIALANETRTRLSVPGSTPIEGRPCVAVDRLDGIISVDETSRVLHVQAGITLSAIEARARDHGWTLDVPTRWHSSQVGTWLADGAPGRRRKADDPVSQFVAGMELVLPTGQEVTIRPAPRRAVGPDLVRAVIGAGGRLGVIVGVHCIAERAAARARLAFSFPDARKASRALIAMRGAGVRPFHSALAGEELYLTVEAEGPRRKAVSEVVNRIVGENDGHPASAQDQDFGSEAPTVDNQVILGRLAGELDPLGILQP